MSIEEIREALERQGFRISSVYDMHTCTNVVTVTKGEFSSQVEIPDEELRGDIFASTVAAMAQEINRRAVTVHKPEPREPRYNAATERHRQRFGPQRLRTA